MSKSARVIVDNIKRMDAAELRDLIAELNRTFQLHFVVREDILTTPDGFELLPLEATAAMIDVGKRFQWTGLTADQQVAELWRAMRRVAPRPE